MGFFSRWFGPRPGGSERPEPVATLPAPPPAPWCPSCGRSEGVLSSTRDAYGRYCTRCGHGWQVDGVVPEGLEP
jgi:hypothetical protein